MIASRDGVRNGIAGVLGAGVFAFVFSGVCFAAHPLITDDAGTQGKGKFQVELDYEFDHDSEAGVQTNTHQIESIVTYGLIDPVDLVVSVPYQFVSVKEGGVKTRQDGFADMAVEVKYRFFEKNGLSLAVKPGLTIPTGDDEKGMGAGKVGGGFQFIATKEIEPWAFHFNAGYGRHETKLDVEETDLWNVSLAAEFKVCPWLKTVANAGAERNTEKGNDTPAAFVLGGVILPVSEHLDLSFGVKGGLSAPEPDVALLSGLTFKF